MSGSGGKKDKDRSNAKNSAQSGGGGPAPATRSNEREQDNSSKRTPQRPNRGSKEEREPDAYAPSLSKSTTKTNNNAPSTEEPSSTVRRASLTSSTSGGLPQTNDRDSWTVRVQRNQQNHGRDSSTITNCSPSHALSARVSAVSLPIENRSGRSSSSNSVHSSPTGMGAGHNNNKNGQGGRTGATPSGSPTSASASSASVSRQSEKVRRGSGASAVSQGSSRHGPPGGVAISGGSHRRDISATYQGTNSPTASSVSGKSGRDSGSSSPGSRSRDEPIYDEVDDDDCKYKTELCRTWMENRTCAYGAGCAYAHGHEDLRDRPRIETFKSTPCTDPARQNFHKCDYGARCNYVHPGEAVRRAFGDRKYYDSVYFEALERDFPYDKFPFGIYL